MTKCPHCDGTGTINPQLEVHLVSCTCGHGGRAWHTQVFGKCNYQNCTCNKLIVKEAQVGRQFFNPEQFLNFLKNNPHGVVYT